MAHDLHLDGLKYNIVSFSKRFRALPTIGLTSILQIAAVFFVSIAVL